MCEPLLTHETKQRGIETGICGWSRDKGSPRWALSQLPVCGPGGARCIGGSQALAWNRRTCRPDRDGRGFWPREGEPQAANTASARVPMRGTGADRRSSGEGPVMGSERRGRAVQGRLEVNPSGEEPTDGPKQKLKSFEIRKRLVFEAWEKVRANSGAPGVDAVSIDDFAAKEVDNLYKLWNRMSSGSYFPGPVRAVEIPKDHGAGVRVLGVPNVADRVAQTAAAMLLEEELEPIFHPDSYRYRPGRSAHGALAVARKRCWNKDWVLDLDVRAFFDSVRHDLLMKAVAHHTDERWVLLYIQRWLKAPMTMRDGTTAPREREPHKDLRSRRCSRTSSCTMRSTSGWTGNTPAVRSSVTRMMWSSTATPSNRPDNCGPASLSGSGPWALSCIPTRRRSCTAKTRTAVMRRSTPASTFSATPSGVAWPVADEASL